MVLLTNQSCVENDVLLINICSLYYDNEDEMDEEGRESETIVLHYMRGNSQTETRKPDHTILATGDALKHIIGLSLEDQVEGITFDGVDEKNDRYTLSQAVFRGRHGYEHDFGSPVEITEKLAKLISNLSEYTFEITAIYENDGEEKYILTEKSAGYKKNGGCFFSDGADDDVCADFQDLGCLFFRGWIER